MNESLTKSLNKRETQKLRPDEMDGRLIVQGRKSGVEYTPKGRREMSGSLKANNDSLSKAWKVSSSREPFYRR